MLKRLRRKKMKRDRQKRTEKVLRNVDAAMLTAHAVHRANERSVSVQDIKQALKTGDINRTGSKRYKVKGKRATVVISEAKKTEKPSHVIVITVWKWKQR